jgi:glyoxylase-like metal-dependent hydrolase (beta-lactamase superfamily II)
MSEREPADWNARAASRPDVAATSLKLPSVLFEKDLYFDDGDQRVELHWFGIAHTRGDGFAWLPKQKVLFTGDACVNGPHNFVGNGDIHQWIETLEAVKQLGAEIVCPGHGPVGGPEIIVDQQQFFVEILKHAKALRDAGKSVDEATIAVPDIDAELKAIPNIVRYVGNSARDKIEKAWRELGGEAFPR